MNGFGAGAAGARKSERLRELAVAAYFQTSQSGGAPTATTISSSAAAAPAPWERVLGDALERTQQRLEGPTSSQEAMRLEQRHHELVRWHDIFASHPEWRLLGLYGRDSSCQLRPKVQRRHLSQFDAVVYSKANGHIFVEQLGSSHALFKQHGGATVAPTPGFDRVVTPGGRRYRYDPQACGFHSDYFETINGVTVRCTSVRRGGAMLPRSVASEQAAPPPRAHGGQDVAGVCICGRGIGTLAAPGSTAHADESLWQHAVAQMNGEAFAPSVLGLAAVLILAPVKLALDIYRACSVPGLWRALKQAQRRSTEPAPAVLQEFYQDTQSLLAANLRSARWSVVPSTLFYGSVLANLTGQIQGFATSAAAGAVAVGLGTLGFGLLGGVAALEGAYELYKLGRLALHKQPRLAVPAPLLKAYRREVTRQVRRRQVLAGAKVGGGVLMVIGTWVPGAQPAMLAGVGLMMAPTLVRGLALLKDKLWCHKPHAHMRLSEQADLWLRLRTFEAMQRREQILQNAQMQLYGACDETTLLKILVDVELALARLHRDEAQSKWIYLRRQLADGHMESSAIGSMNGAGRGAHPDPDAASVLHAELAWLAAAMERHQATINALRPLQKRATMVGGAGALDRGDIPGALTALLQTGLLAEAVVPQPRGLLKRGWNRKSLKLRLEQHLVELAPTTSRWQRRYELASDDPQALWRYLKEASGGVTAKMRRVLHERMHGERHGRAALCAYDMQLALQAS